MTVKLTRLTHKIAIQLYLVTESCTICRRPVQKLLDTLSYIELGQPVLMAIQAPFSLASLWRGAESLERMKVMRYSARFCDLWLRPQGGADIWRVNEGAESQILLGDLTHRARLPETETSERIKLQLLWSLALLKDESWLNKLPLCIFKSSALISNCGMGWSYSRHLSVLTHLVDCRERHGAVLWAPVKEVRQRLSIGWSGHWGAHRKHGRGCHSVNHAAHTVCNKQNTVASRE
jgi:hypothetical protein